MRPKSSSIAGADQTAPLEQTGKRAFAPIVHATGRGRGAYEYFWNMEVPEPASPLPWAETPDPSHILFAYGTLMLTTGIPDVDAALRDAGLSVGRGWIHGRLFDLGEYPGAVAGPAAGAGEADSPRIRGSLLHLKDPAAFYAVIDRYEGFEPGDPGASEFVRAQTRAYLPGMEQGVLCQVYWYNGPIQGRPEITSGDYLAYWQSRGRPSQGRIVS